MKKLIILCTVLMTLVSCTDSPEKTSSELYKEYKEAAAKEGIRAKSQEKIRSGEEGFSGTIKAVYPEKIYSGARELNATEFKFKSGNHYYKAFVMRNTDLDRSTGYMGIVHDPDCEISDLLDSLKAL